MRGSLYILERYSNLGLSIVGVCTSQAEADRLCGEYLPLFPTSRLTLSTVQLNDTNGVHYLGFYSADGSFHEAQETLIKDLAI